VGKFFDVSVTRRCELLEILTHFCSDILAPLTFRIFVGSYYSLNDVIHSPLALNS
jgi:hypothetical protein